MKKLGWQGLDAQLFYFGSFGAGFYLTSAAANSRYILRADISAGLNSGSKLANRSSLLAAIGQPILSNWNFLPAAEFDGGAKKGKSKMFCSAVLRSIPSALILMISSLPAAMAQTTEMSTDLAAVGADATTLADHIAIKELSSYFDNTIDEGDIDRHMTLWHDDMQFISPFGDFDNKDDYRAWVTEFHNSTQAYGGTRHLVVNNVISIEGDRATQTCYQIILSQTSNDGAPAVLASTRMEDELIKTENGWRFTKRVLNLDQDPARFQD